MKSKAIQPRSNCGLFAGAVIFILLAALGLRAEDTNTVELIQRLEKRIEELEQKVKALERDRPGAGQSTNAPAQQRPEAVEQMPKGLEGTQPAWPAAVEGSASRTPKITAGDQGFSLASPDGEFTLQLKGVLQVDSRTFFNDAGIVGNDGFLLRRARPVLEGTVFRDFKTTSRLPDGFLPAAQAGFFASIAGFWVWVERQL